MFDRFIFSALQEWYLEPNRKPLLLRGARQVGKTTAVVNFAKRFPQFLHLNLEKKEDQAPFLKATSVTDQMQALFFLKNLNWQKRQDTLIFIDEIQEIPEALNQMRYIHEAHPEITLIASGSLLEILLQNPVQVPVGRLRYMVMRPVSFAEFLNALGEIQALEAWNTLPFPVYATEKLYRLYHLYALIGGMPEVVARYVETRDLTTLASTYESLLLSYLEDIEKYAPNKADIIRLALRACFTESGKRIKFAGFGHSAFGSREMGQALRTLERALLIHLVAPESSATLPFLPDQSKSPRLHFLDSGLMNYFAGIQKEIIGTHDLQSLWQGRMIEHLTGQELLATHHSPLYQLHFWARDKKNASAEVDYLIPVDGKVIPMEVKSGSAGKLRSLHQFMDISPHDLAIRLYHGSVEKNTCITPSGKTFTLLNLPYFLAGKVVDYVKRRESIL
jgi:uncharacterized protein